MTCQSHIAVTPPLPHNCLTFSVIHKCGAKHHRRFYLASLISAKTTLHGSCCQVLLPTKDGVEPSWIAVVSASIRSSWGNGLLGSRFGEQRILSTVSSGQGLCFLISLNFRRWESVCRVSTLGYVFPCSRYNRMLFNNFSFSFQNMHVFQSLNFLISLLLDKLLNLSLAPLQTCTMQ